MTLGGCQEVGHLFGLDHSNDGCANGRQIVLSPEGRYLFKDGKIHTSSAAPGVARIHGMGYNAFRNLVACNT